eukprot:8669014-Pyramimonas_sp.AAC.1
MGRGQEDPRRARDPNASATPVVSFDWVSQSWRRWRLSQTHPGGGQGPKDWIPHGSCCRGEREPDLRHSSHQR